jgi:hypothetical protein
VVHVAAHVGTNHESLGMFGTSEVLSEGAETLTVAPLML